MPEEKRSMKVIDVTGLSFSYRDEPVLANLTFHVDENVFIGLIGPNGGGKTTLMKILLGELTGFRGEVRVLGSVPSALGEKRSLIGYVPQRATMNWQFPATVRDAVLMGAYAKAGLCRGVRREERERLDEVLEALDIAEIADKPVGKASGGQQQRAFIARALVTRPKLLILDEPMAGIDSAGQGRFFETIKAVKERFGLTVLMISHDVGEMEHFADQIACLNKYIHWHDHSELLTEDVLRETYECELSAFLSLKQEQRT